jgi:hypothetical protein
MTLAEICFIIAAILLAVDALPMIGIASPVKLQSSGLIFIAIGLALGAGLAANLGVEGTVI